MPKTGRTTVNKVFDGRNQKQYKEDNKEKIEQYQRLYNQSRDRDKIAHHNKAYLKMNTYTIMEINKTTEKTKKGGGNIMRKTKKEQMKE